jgi:hypothetical protein
VTIRAPRRAVFGAVLILTVLLTSSYYTYVKLRRIATSDHPVGLLLDPARSTNPDALLAEASRLYWLNNGRRAAPLFAKAERLFADKGDARNELYAKVGRLRSEAETMSFVDLSRFLEEQLQNPITQNDKQLRLWCLVAKGYTDIEIDYKAAKRDWLEAQDIAKNLNEDQWVPGPPPSWG